MSRGVESSYKQEYRFKQCSGKVFKRELAFEVQAYSMRVEDLRELEIYTDWRLRLEIYSGWRSGLERQQATASTWIYVLCQKAIESQEGSPKAQRDDWVEWLDLGGRPQNHLIDHLKSAVVAEIEF